MSKKALVCFGSFFTAWKRGISYGRDKKEKIVFWPDVYKEQGHWLPTLAWAEHLKDRFLNAKYLSNCVSLIEKGLFETCKEEYMQMVEWLKVKCYGIFLLEMAKRRP